MRQKLYHLCCLFVSLLEIQALGNQSARYFSLCGPVCSLIQWTKYLLSQCTSLSLFLGPLMIVVEFAEHGNLLRHLRDRRKQNYEDMNEYSLDITSAERVRIACDVADGMKHLATMKVLQRCCLKNFLWSQPSTLHLFLSHSSAKY